MTNGTHGPQGNVIIWLKYLWTTIYSPYQLAVNERYSTINIYNGSNYSQLSSLAHIPLRPSNDYYTLSDIFTNGQSLDGSLLNILAAIGSVCYKRTLICVF